MIDCGVCGKPAKTQNALDQHAWLYHRGVRSAVYDPDRKARRERERAQRVIADPPIAVSVELPQIVFPADPETLRVLAAGCDFLASQSIAIREAGMEAQMFFGTLRSNLRARAQRAEKTKAA